MIKDFSINAITGEVVITVSFDSGIAKVHAMPAIKGSDGGPELLAIAQSITSPTEDFLYYNGSQLVNAGPVPAFHKWSWEAYSFVDTRTVKDMWVNVRKERDHNLLSSDWTQLPDVPLSTKEAWATYRQALRDITLQPDPFNIVWPTPPT